MYLSRMRVLSLSVTLLASLGPAESSARGLFDDLDYCKAQQQDFKSNAAAYDSYAKATLDQWDAWHTHPNTIPDKLLESYRTRVRAATYASWSESDLGRATINSW